LNDDLFVDDYEMNEIIENYRLLERLKKGHKDGKLKRGKLIV